MRKAPSIVTLDVFTKKLQANEIINVTLCPDRAIGYAPSGEGFLCAVNPVRKPFFTAFATNTSITTLECAHFIRGGEETLRKLFKVKPYLNALTLTHYQTDEKDRLDLKVGVEYMRSNQKLTHFTLEGRLTTSDAKNYLPELQRHPALQLFNLQGVIVGDGMQREDTFRAIEMIHAGLKGKIIATGVEDYDFIDDKLTTAPTAKADIHALIRELYQVLTTAIKGKDIPIVHLLAALIDDNGPNAIRITADQKAQLDLRFDPDQDISNLMTCEIPRGPNFKSKFKRLAITSHLNLASNRGQETRLVILSFDDYHCIARRTDRLEECRQHLVELMPHEYLENPIKAAATVKPAEDPSLWRDGGWQKTAGIAHYYHRKNDPMVLHALSETTGLNLISHLMVVDVGGGDGRLAKVIIPALFRLGCQHLHYTLIEPSPLVADAKEGALSKLAGLKEEFKERLTLEIQNTTLHQAKLAAPAHLIILSGVITMQVMTRSPEAAGTPQDANAAMAIVRKWISPKGWVILSGTRAILFTAEEFEQDFGFTAHRRVFKCKASGFTFLKPFYLLTENNGDSGPGAGPAAAAAASP